MQEVIKGVSVTISLCIITSLGGRKKDSYLIALAGVSFILISVLTGVNSASAAVEASWFGQVWDKLCGFIHWIFN